jgi:LemA protein
LINIYLFPPKAALGSGRAARLTFSEKRAPGASAGYLYSLMSALVIALIVIVVVLAGYGIVTYNALVRLRVAAQEALADIDVQLKRRHDLIPNLVETVKGYASHEQGVFQQVTEARAAAMQSSVESDPAAAGQAEGALNGALIKLMAVAENYPDLKASENFQQLQAELSATEDKIAASRRYYNTAVRTLNIKVQQFPASIIAGATGFRAQEFFEIEEPGEKDVPQVSF